MPFFQQPLSKDLKNKRLVTLQVRIPLKICGCPEKRVLSSASIPTDTGGGRRLISGMTVEAALVLPLFLFAVVILMIPMKMMNEGRKIQTNVDAVCAEISQYASLLTDPSMGEGDCEDGGLPPELSGNLSKAGFRIYAEGKVRSQIDAKNAGEISLADSRILEDEDTVDLILHYRLYLPFPVFRMNGIPMTARSCRRAWIGRSGLSESDAADQGTGDELVYVGKNSTRYHRSRTCHYLYNDISAIPFEALEQARNSSGRKYKPCARCGGTAHPGDVVYIMPSGESYHSSRNCSAIVSYVRAAPLSEVGYLGPCSYCAQ